MHYVFLEISIQDVVTDSSKHTAFQLVIPLQPWLLKDTLQLMLLVTAGKK